MPNCLEVDKLTKVYETLAGNKVYALNGISFLIKAGEFLAIVGPSGSGKSTLLHILAGIEKPSSGSVNFSLDTGPPRTGLVFQANTIFPWRTVGRNLTYSLELRKADRLSRNQKAVELCGLIGLDPDVFLTKYPKELSGGEKRRVAIGMALGYDANLLLFDEPTSQLDYISKWEIQKTILDISFKNRLTSILVSHDIDEAILLGDYVLVLDRGAATTILEIKLPRPRDPSLRGSTLFNSYRDLILESHEAMR